jgi:hypothetical protein
MLLRPTRLPRRFNRHVSKSTAAFVKRRHVRRRQYTRERWVRGLRKSQRVFSWGWDFLRQWLWLSLATALLITFGVILFSPLVHVREMRVKRTDPRLDSEKIQKALRPLFGKHLFFLPAQDVRLLVQDAMPDAAKIEVDKQYPSTLAITITLQSLLARLQIDEEGRGSVAAVTASGSALPSGSGSVKKPAPRFDYLTENGLYLSLPFEAAVSAPLQSLRIVDWAVRPAPGSPLLSPDFLKRMRAAEELLRQQYGLKVTERTVYLRAREFHLRTPRYSLWFDASGPLQDQFFRYGVFLKNVPQGEARQYVDLRLVGRVVYK